MDFVSSPVSDEQRPPNRLPDRTKPKPDLFLSSDHITTQEASEHPSPLQKPPLLKHVYVTQQTVRLTTNLTSSQLQPRIQQPAQTPPS